MVRDCATGVSGCTIVVVVNGCEDDTAQQAKNAGATHHPFGSRLRKCIVGRISFCCPARRFALAVANGCGWPTSAQYIPVLLDALDGADLSIGSRLVEGWFSRVALLRRWTISLMGVADTLDVWTVCSRCVEWFSGHATGSGACIGRRLFPQLDRCQCFGSICFERVFTSLKYRYECPKDKGEPACTEDWKSLFYAGRTLLAVRDEMRGEKRSKRVKWRLGDDDCVDFG